MSLKKTNKKTKIFAFLGLAILWIHTLYIWKILTYMQERFSDLRGRENSQQLCKPLTLSRVCITVSNSPNSSQVYIRLHVCKHGHIFYCLNNNSNISNFAINQFQVKHYSDWLIEECYFYGINCCRNKLLFWHFMNNL